MPASSVRFTARQQAWLDILVQQEARRGRRADTEVGQGMGGRWGGQWGQLEVEMGRQPTGRAYHLRTFKLQRWLQAERAALGLREMCAVVAQGERRCLHDSGAH